jgi:poly(3-hydroxybutyrate) depolymerase
MNAPARLIIPLLMACAAFSSSRAETDRIPDGKGEIMISLDAYNIKVYTYRPKTYSAAKSPMLVVFHGHSRNPETYLENASLLGDKNGVLVLAPDFDEKQFPSGAYNHGNVIVHGVVQPREKWTFSLVPRLIEKFRGMESRPDMPYYLLGHSAGGQFVERLMVFTDLTPVRAVAANPGSHLFPSRTLKFPYGFGELPSTLGGDDAIKAYLAKPLTIYLGTADTDPHHPLLDKKEEAERQGSYRLARGRHCYEAGKKLAESKGWTSRTKVERCSRIRPAKRRSLTATRRREF